MRRVWVLLAIGFLCLTQTYAEEGRGGFQSQRDGVVHLDGFSLVINDSIKPPVMYPEPKFTRGNSNTVFWSSHYDTFYVQYDTTHSFDSPTTSPPVSDTFWTPGNELVNGQTYWYRVLAKSGSEASHWSDSTSSTQDSVPPTIDSVRIPEANPLGWCNDDTIHVYFTASDTSGIDSVQLYYRLRGESSWIPSSERSYRPDPITGESFYPSMPDSLPFTAVSGDTCYELFLWAKDAAHAPESHGCDSVHLPCLTWKVEGNPRPFGPDTAVRVDTHSPTSQVDIPSCFATLNLEIFYHAGDEYSGLDSVCLYRQGPGDISFKLRECQKLSGQLSAASFFVDSVYAEGEYHYYTRAYDRAGNEQMECYPETTAVDTSILEGIRLEDTTFAEHPLNKAREGWTKADTILVIAYADTSIEIACLDTICAYEKEGATICEPWGSTTFVDTLFPFPLNDSVGRHTVCCTLKAKDNGWTLPRCNRIFYDLSKPHIGEIHLCDLDTQEPPCSGFTDSTVIRVSWQGVRDSTGLDWIFISTDSIFDYSDTNFPATESGDVLFDLGEGFDGPRMVWFAVRDSAGNADTVVGSIGLDRVPPTSEVICDSLPDTTTVLKFKVWFTARDSIYPSGLDTVWLYAVYESDTIPVCTLDSFPDSSAIDTFCTFEADSGDGWYYFYTIAKDRAGNKQATPACICSTYVTTELAIELTLYDRDDPNDTRYTDEDTVGARVKLLRGDPSHTYDIYFFERVSCVGETLCQWDSVYFNSGSTKDSVIALPNSEEQGLKVVFCQITDLQAHSTSNCTNANIIYDSLPCTMDSLQLFDLLTFEEDSTDGAWHGYTDSILVRTFIFGLNCGDNLDEYAPPESIRFMGNIPGSTLVVPFRDTVDTIRLTEGDGPKTVFCEVLDSAGNWSRKNGGSITLDTYIDSISIDVDSFVYSANVGIRFFEGRNTDLFRSWKRDVYQGNTCRESMQFYSNLDTFMICDSTGYHNIYVQVRDSAGNWSPDVYDSTFYPPSCSLLDITLKDTFPLQGPGMAKTGWTNDTCIWLLPKWECSAAKSIAVMDCDCSDSTCNDTVKYGLRDTILIHLNPTYQRHCIEAWLTYADTVSNSVHATIVYDSTPPELRLMDVREDQLTEGWEWVLDPEIEVDIEAFDNECLYSYDFIENGISRWTEVNTFRGCPGSFKGNLQNTLRSGEGKIDLLLAIYDAGGNSDTLGDTIYYDLQEPIVAFPNPFDPRKEKAVIRLQKTIHARAKIYDVFGNSVRTLRKDRGTHDFVWDGRNDNGDMVANGGYICVVGRHKIKVAVKK